MIWYCCSGCVLFWVCHVCLRLLVVVDHVKVECFCASLFPKREMSAVEKLTVVKNMNIAVVMFRATVLLTVAK